MDNTCSRPRIQGKRKTHNRVLRHQGIARDDSNVSVIGSDEDEFAKRHNQILSKKSRTFFQPYPRRWAGNRCMDMNIAGVLEMLDIRLPAQGQRG